MPKIRFENEQMTVEVEEGTSIRDAALEHGIIVNRFALDCGGKGFPGCNCKVWLRGAPDRVSKRTCWEKLPGRYMRDGTTRLACQTRVHGDITVITQP